MTTLDARPNTIDIDLDALDSNVREIRRRIRPGVAIIASVKANAYGHGIVPISRRLSAAGVEVLATGSFADAVAVRKAGITTPVLMMGGALPAAMPELSRHDLIPTVHNQELADAVTANAERRTQVYVKVDCGFGRLGVPIDEAKRFILDLARAPNIEISGLYTHLPFADATGRDWALRGIAQFDELVAQVAEAGLTIPVTQARASAALLTGIDDNCTAVSPGALLYGLSPVRSELADRSALRPVLSRISTRLIQTSDGGASGARGVVPFGRVDGHRAPVEGSRAHMLIDGVKAPILSVSLEHTVLDLSTIPKVAVGDPVVVLGRSGDRAIAIEDIALWQGVGGCGIGGHGDACIAIRRHVLRLVAHLKTIQRAGR